MIDILNLEPTILQLNCNMIELLTLHSNRTLYGIDCDLETIFNNIVQSQRYIDILTYLSECNVVGNIVDEINNFIKDLIQTYSLTCIKC